MFRYSTLHRAIDLLVMKNRNASMGDKLWSERVAQDKDDDKKLHSAHMTFDKYHMRQNYDQHDRYQNAATIVSSTKNILCRISIEALL